MVEGPFPQEASDSKVCCKPEWSLLSLVLGILGTGNDSCRDLGMCRWPGPGPDLLLSAHPWDSHFILVGSSI